MALPSDWSTVNVVGTFIGPDGSAISGKIQFTLSSRTVLPHDKETVIVKPITATLNNGSFAVVLAATDDPDLSPTGLSYQVQEIFDAPAVGTTYSIQVPAALSGTTVDITTLQAQTQVAPLAPTNVQATGGTNSVTLTYTAATGATSYRATSSDGRITGTSNGTATTITIGNVAAGTVGPFTVVAIGPGGTSPASSPTGTVTVTAGTSGGGGGTGGTTTPPTVVNKYQVLLGGSGSSPAGSSPYSVTITAPATGNTLVLLGSLGLNITAVSGGRVTWAAATGSPHVDVGADGYYDLAWVGKNASGTTSTTVTVTLTGTPQFGGLIQLYELSGVPSDGIWSFVGVDSNGASLSSSSLSVAVPTGSNIYAAFTFLETLSGDAPTAVPTNWTRVTASGTIDGAYIIPSLVSSGGNPPPPTTTTLTASYPLPHTDQWSTGILVLGTAVATVGTGGTTGGGGTGGQTGVTPPAVTGTRVINELFPVNAALGTFTTNYGPRGWAFYGAGGTDTSGVGRYGSDAVNKTYSVNNGILTIDQHVDTDGYGLGGVATQYIGLTQGSRFGLALKVNIISGGGAGFKAVPCMGWPMTNQWTSEIDFAEVNDWAENCKCKLFAGPDGNNGAYWFGPDNTGINLADGNVHTIHWEWGSTLVGVIDGNRFDMGHVPTSPMRPLLQWEAWIGAGNVPAGAHVITQIYYVYADTA